MYGHGEHYGSHGCFCGEYGFGFGMHSGPWMRFGPRMHFIRHFPTREERIAWLEEYLKELQAEAKAVEERIAEMKKTR